MGRRGIDDERAEYHTRLSLSAFVPPGIAFRVRVARAMRML